MSVISKKQYSEAYAIGCRVYNNEITLNEGKSILIDIHKLNSASATDYIYAVKHMLNGDVYKRALSAGGVEYYLEKINDDFGMAALNKAIISVNKHIEYYEGIGKKTKLNKLRIIIDKLNNNTIPTLIDSFYEQVKKSIQEPSLIRKERLLSANKYPEKKTIRIEIYVRNPDVVAETLIRANGKCEHCHSNAPFLRKSNNTPYLEVHHIIPLSSGGMDCISNTIATCPNCHRHLHYGNSI